MEYYVSHVAWLGTEWEKAQESERDDDDYLWLF